MPPPPNCTYRIGRGETGVLTYEPYKSTLLPLWRFRTPAVARESAEALWSRFETYDAENDFVGMDMCRKFLQMGMTRAARYANYRGGRKYAETGDKAVVEQRRAKEASGKVERDVSEIEERREDDGEGEEEGKGTEGREGVGRKRVLLPKSEDHKGKKEKQEASEVFKAYWTKARQHEGYLRRKEEFLKEQRRRDKREKVKTIDEESGEMMSG